MVWVRGCAHLDLILCPGAGTVDRRALKALALRGVWVRVPPRVPVTGYDDDDDWVGEPPEGRYTSDRAKPEFWAGKRPPSIVAAGIGLVLLILALVILL